MERASHFRHMGSSSRDNRITQELKLREASETIAPTPYPCPDCTVRRTEVLGTSRVVQG